jgi:hypothetical protein
MPLKNDPEKDWVGWLVDDMASQEEAYQNKLAAALEARNIPNCTVKKGQVNMWWKDSGYIDVTSTMDGSVTATIHIHGYGTSLWIGRAVDTHQQWNYYKRMATQAFIETIDRCIRETTLTLVGADAIHDVSDVE